MKYLAKSRTIKICDNIWFRKVKRKLKLCITVKRKLLIWKKIKETQIVKKYYKSKTTFS